MTEWPLAGRVEELRVLRELLTGPESRPVVLAGMSGVGKTRLGHEALVLGERAGMATAQAMATRSAAQLPFGALAPLLPELPAPGAIDDRVDLLRRSTTALTERGDGRRLLLFVDDAHLLDDASATLVHQLAATGSAAVLVSVRVGEPAPDPIVALWKDRLAERLELGGLDAAGTEELLATVLDGPVDPAAAVQLTERCRGNALFLRELVTGALDDGTLYDDDGIWRLRRPLSPSARLIEIIEARLGQLDEHERALMELVAYGEPLGQAELATLSDPALAETLERRALLASHMDGRRLVVHLAHPLYGDVLRGRTPALRARAITRSLAEAVERAGPERQEDVLRVATWRLKAGDGRPDVLFEGATIARWRYDFPLAERLARAAGDAGAGFDAALLAARLASLQGRTDEAERDLVALGAAAEDDVQRGRVAIARFNNSVAFVGRDEVQILDEAEATITDQAWRDEIEARRVTLLFNTLGPRAAAEAARPLIARATGEALIFASLVGGYGLVRLGRLQDAIEASDRGYAARVAIDTPLGWYPWWHTVIRCRALQQAGRYAEADEIVEAEYRRALAAGSTEAQAVFAGVRANVVGERGHIQSVARSAREAVALNQQLARPILVRQAHIFGALALALGGHAKDAAAELAAVDALDLPTVWRDAVDLLRARAWTAVAAGDLAGARAHLDRAVEVGDEIGDHVGVAAALHVLARLGRAAEVEDRLIEVAGRIDGDLVPARVAHVTALAAGDADGLEAASRDFEAMGADLLAAEASADAAVARRRAGRSREAAAADRRTGELAARAEGPVTPALLATPARALLTPAERETAVMAANGRSNKEIAELLFLSPRTVENRLQRIYEKLGVTGRTQLAEVLVLDS